MNRHLFPGNDARADTRVRPPAFRRAATLLLGVALMAGCAASPEDIAPEYVDEARYQGWTCEQYSVERTRVETALTTASATQKETRSNDVAGVIFLALPLGSMTGEDLAPEIARLKGERDALDRGRKKINCG